MFFNLKRVMVTRQGGHVIRPGGKENIYVHLEDSESDQVLIDSEAMAREILPFIQRSSKDLTGHGVGHSVSVIRYLNKLITILKEEGTNLSQTEIKLLYCAAWLHDIGNLTTQDRKEHSKESCRLINRLEKAYNFLEDLRSSLLQIVLYHQSRYDLSKVPDRPLHIHGDIVRLRLLAAVFRLADACHIGGDRAHRLVYYLLEDQMDDNSKPHWIGNSSVLSIDFDVPGERILVTVSDINAAKLLTDGFIEDFERIKPHLLGYLPLQRVDVECESELRID